MIIVLNFFWFVSKVLSGDRIVFSVVMNEVWVTYSEVPPSCVRIKRDVLMVSMSTVELRSDS